MAGDDGVWCVDEGVIRCGWLAVGDVCSVAADFAAGESVGEILGVNNFASCTVDDDDAIAHFADFCGVDHAVGFFVERAVERNDVGVFENFIHVSAFFDLMLREEFFIEVWGEGDDVHAECFGADGDFFTDAAKADDAEGFPHDFIANWFFPTGDPFSVLHGDGVALNFFGEAEKEA